REVAELRQKLALGGGAGRGEESEQIHGVGFIGRVVSDVTPKDLKPLADAAKASLGSGIAVFIGLGDDQRASVVVGVTEDLTDRFNAVELVRDAAAVLGGK